MHPCSGQIRLYYRNARSWRAQARNLRKRAEHPYLTPGQRNTLLFEADTSDQLADTWIKGAEDDFLRPA